MVLVLLILMIDCIYCLVPFFFFVLCAFFLLPARLPLLSPVKMCALLSLFFCLLFVDTYQTDQTKPLLCLQAFLPSFIPYLFLQLSFFLSFFSLMCWCL